MVLAIKRQAICIEYSILVAYARLLVPPAVSYQVPIFNTADFTMPATALMFLQDNALSQSKTLIASSAHLIMNLPQFPCQ